MYKYDKIHVEKGPEDMFLEAIFSYMGKLFLECLYKIFVFALHDIIGLQIFSLSFCQS